MSWNISLCKTWEAKSDIRLKMNVRQNFSFRTVIIVMIQYFFSSSFYIVFFRKNEGPTKWIRFDKTFFVRFYFLSSIKNWYIFTYCLLFAAMIWVSRASSLRRKISIYAILYGDICSIFLRFLISIFFYHFVDAIFRDNKVRKSY